MTPYLFKKQPYTHQLEALAKSKDAEYFAFLMEMRTGKSKVLVDEACYFYRTKKITGLVIVTMTTLCRMWANEQLPSHVPDDVSYTTCLWQRHTKAFEKELVKFGEPSDKLKVFLMNIEAVKTERGYDTLQAFLKKHNVLLAIDESTIIKGADSAQSKIIRKLGRLAKYRRILTGTPAPERPLDLYAQYDFLKEGCLGHTSYFSFKNRYTITQPRYVNGRKFNEIVGYQRLDELQKKIDAISYRKLRKECFDIAENRYPLYIELSPAQKLYYEQLRDEALTWLGTDLVTAPLIITRLMRLKQALCNIAVTDDGQVREISEHNPRMDGLLQTLQEAGDKKVIVWSNFTPSIKKICQEIERNLGKNSSAAIYGEISLDDRDAARISFNNPSSDLRYLVMQPGVGGFGLDLTASDTMIYHDHDWRRERREQSETRILGPMQKSDLMTWIDIVAKGTMDEIQLEMIKSKKDLSDQVTGDNLRELLRAKL